MNVCVDLLKFIRLLICFFNALTFFMPFLIVIFLDDKHNRTQGRLCSIANRNCNATTIVRIDTHSDTIADRRHQIHNRYRPTPTRSNESIIHHLFATAYRAHRYAIHDDNRYCTANFAV